MIKGDINQALSECRICPKNCGVNRNAGQVGKCGEDAHLRIARAALHHWEEPCISGTRGSGTVFFTGCSLQCGFCQNRLISYGQHGKRISIHRLSDIFLELAKQGAHNINLVTPTHFIPQIKEALLRAKNMGLCIPIVYNSSGYEEVYSLKQLDGLIDIYLTDIKFFSPEIAFKIAGSKDYFSAAKAALQEMYRQTGKSNLDETGMMKQGVIVRHLMLPGYLFDTRKILHFLCENYANQIYISLMNQYTPPKKKIDNIPDRMLSKEHYERMIAYLMDYEIELAYVQEDKTSDESFIPAFDYTGV